MSAPPKIIAALQVVLIAGAMACLPRFNEGALHFSSWLGFAGAFLICAVGVCAASLSANIHYAARHLYNAHYAAIPVALCIVWPMQFLASLETEDWFRAFLSGCLALAGPWTVMHLLASASNRRSGSLAIAAAAMCSGFALLRPSPAFLLAVLVVASALVTGLIPKDRKAESPAPAASKSWAALSFILFNMIAACGCGAMLGMFFMYMFAMGTDLESHAMTIAGTGADFAQLQDMVGAFKLLAARFSCSIIAMLVVPVFVFLWPETTRTRLTVALGAACVAAAAGIGGQQSLTPGMYTAVVSIALLSLATVVCAEGARASRWPHAIIAAAVAATVLLQNYGGTLEEASPALTAYLIEGVYLAILWETAYFAGVRTLRTRANAADGIDERSTDKRIPATDRPMPTPSPGTR